ncbi:MAG: glycoside hydrolase family 127 protein [Candidatus Hydrogenedentes bacterium]|nr:glycoside hydrolase family 127 protein [Candidatus Hydrogenedentota bacterium]
MGTSCLPALLALLVISVPAAAQDAPPLNLMPFDLTAVRLLDGPCNTALEANRAYLHALDPERLLYAFRVNAGLPAPCEPPGGWEKPDCEVRGHFAGHYLSACALMYAAAGDAALKARADYLVAEFAKCQAALGGEYLSAFPENFWDRLESMEKPPWAPYYTIHKIMAGLYDAHMLCGNAQALDVLKGMAAYFKKRRDRLTLRAWDRVLEVEFGGMAEVLYNLYALTGNADHRDLAHAFDRAAFLGPLALEHDNLSGIHANTHIPEVVGAARRYELLGDARYRLITEFFWDCVVNHRTYATGGTSNSEFWGDPDQLAGTLSASNQESCTSYNMLRVTRHLIRWTADPKYADFYMRAFYNSILGTQRAADGMLAYFTPLACGHKRVFGTPDDAFWCCYGTGVESFAKLADSVYFHDGDGLYVHLFIPSEVVWKEQGLRLEQQTRFPDEEHITFTLHLDKDRTFTLNVLQPWWARQGAAVAVNGEPQAIEPRPSTYLALRREWHDGDVLLVTMPMALHAEPMPDDAEKVAVMYGPIVLAGLTSEDTWVQGQALRPEEWLEPVAGRPATFRTVGQETDITFVPLNRVVEESYGVYFIVTPEGSPRHRQLSAEREARRVLAARTVDRVAPNDAELERAHNLQGEKTGSGPHMGRNWRHATDGGWFSWDLRVLPDAPMTLHCVYWGDDAPPRSFQVQVDGTPVADVSLNHNAPGKFLDAEYPLPEALTQGKNKITVRFQAGPGNFAGGVFECAILKPAP